MATDPERVPIREEPDIVRVRQAVRAAAKRLGFGLVDQTKLVTAASELARNALIHGGGGRCEVEVVQGQAREGIRLTFSDEGPGIPDLERAFSDGFSTQGGLGLGLGGARRLVDEFAIDSEPGRGTQITVLRWA